MKDDRVPGVIDDTVAVAIERPNDVQYSAWLANAVKPGLSKNDSFNGLGFFIDNMQHLYKSAHKTVSGRMGGI